MELSLIIIIITTVSNLYINIYSHTKKSSCCGWTLETDNKDTPIELVTK